MVVIILQKVIEMYYRRKKSGKWLIEIQRKGYPRLSKSFESLKLGKKWGRKIEQEIETGQYEDLTMASRTTVKALLEIKFVKTDTKIKKDDKIITGF